MLVASSALEERRLLLFEAADTTTIPTRKAHTMNRTFKQTFHFALCPALLALGLAGPVSAQSTAHGSEQMHQTMMSGMQSMQSMKMSGDTDKDFAMMMKMHHQQALDMARVEIQHGKSPELKAMAQKIIKDQTKEIAKLDAWLQKHQ